MQLIAGEGDHDDAGVNDAVVFYDCFFFGDDISDVAVSQSIFFDFLYFLGQLLPIAPIDGFFFQYLCLIVIGHVVCEVCAEFVERCRVYGDSLNVFTFVFDTDLLYPPFSLH